MSNAGSSSKRSAADAAVDLTAPEDSDHETERLSPVKDVKNPYAKKKTKPNGSASSSSFSRSPGLGAMAIAKQPSASNGARQPPSVVADLTLPETASNEEEPPEMLKPEAVPKHKENSNAGSSEGQRPKKETTKKAATKAKKGDDAGGNKSTSIPGPIRPCRVPALRSNPFDRSGPRWSTYQGKLLIRTAPPSSKPKPPTKTKVAAFDMDGTLLITLGVRHASNFGDLQLWSSTVMDKIRSLHDDEGYKLLLISNQGSIHTQLDGKKAMFIRSVIDWLAHAIGRPFNAVVSCDKTNGFHKPLAGMWSISEQKFNGGDEFDLSQSFYVGDSIPGDSQGGVDMQFAANVGDMRGGTLKFYTPEEFWGPSDYDRRCAARAAKVDAESYECPPSSALRTRAALCGGYLRLDKPILLLLMGVQGSGKSTFCRELLDASSKAGGVPSWTHLSQDTINGGRPGKREAVEKAALEGLKAGKCVIIDRMHLTPEQRAYFVAVAREAGVNPHVIWFDVPKTVVERRVRARSDHVGGVGGDAGARMAVQSLSQVVAPLYAEGFDLISRIRNEKEVKNLAIAYGFSMAATSATVIAPRDPISPAFVLKASCGEEKIKAALPSVTLGTMNMGKRVAANLVSSAVRAGFRSVDTAPTYNNEEEVGQGIGDGASKPPYVIIKVPKSAVSPQEARAEVTASLKRLGLKKADMIILHWPCEFIESETLGPVWIELESMVSEGLASSLGVSNFSVGALRVLLPLCRMYYPAINQVERHPLLPQWELFNFCHTRGIILQAHSALGQGKETLLRHPTIVSIAQDFGLQSIPDMLLRWNLTQGVAVVTKSSSYERQRAAASEMHPLPPEAMKRLDVIGNETRPHRFINPPFMYRPGAPWAWGNKM